MPRVTIDLPPEISPSAPQAQRVVRRKGRFTTHSLRSFEARRHGERQWEKSYYLFCLVWGDGHGRQTQRLRRGSSLREAQAGWLKENLTCFSHGPSCSPVKVSLCDFCVSSEAGG